MATIKDIAKLAGVSHGTVSNVLNGRGNVSVKKIKLVEQAVQQLGYQLNLQAKILKEGSAKTISVILPNITKEQYAYLYEGLFNYANDQGYELALYLTYDSKELELQHISKVAVKRDHAVITISALADAQPYYQSIKIADEKIIFVYRKPAQAKQFITLDFEQAGEDIAAQMIKHHYRHIGLFCCSYQHHHANLFKQGLENAFAQQNYSVRLDSIASAPSESSYNLAFQFFTEQHPQYHAIITMDMEQAHFIRNANFFGSLDNCPPIYTLANNRFYYESDFYQYHMNYGMLSEQIIKLIEDKPITPLVNKGFSLLPAILPTKLLDSAVRGLSQTAQVINFLILPSPSTEAVKKLLPHFKKVSGIDVNLIVKPFDEIYDIVENFDQHPQIDIVRLDMAGLPWFAPSIFKPLIELDLNVASLFERYQPEIVERFSYVDNKAYAIPFDPSVQMLFYRKDLFDDPLIKRAYFEKYRQHLQIPTNFKDFNQIATFFNQQHNSESPIEYGSCITLGNDEIIASEFLLRYYVQGGKLFNEDKLCLNHSIALSTLTQLQTFIQSANNIDASWWQQSVNLFEQGKLAMLIVYTNLFSYINHRDILPLIGYSNVPGNRALFGGGSLGMSKYSQKDKAVKTFFDWLYSVEINEQIALLGGATAQKNIMQNQPIVNQSPWLPVAQLQYANGIRENSINGKAINLHLVEHIIGQYLSGWISGQFSAKQVIALINESISEQYC